jgi:hypothetical protein
MKVIVENETKLAKYLLQDNTPVEILENMIKVGDPNNLDFIIGDLNSSNATMIESVVNTRIANADVDWMGNKYIYDGGWQENPDWVEPEESEDE